ncbi:methylmalonyl-CoA epimerase [Acidobacteriota bacterium]
MINKVDHIGIAVKDLEKSLTIWKDIFGLHAHGIEDIKERGVRVVRLGESPSIELVSGIGEGSVIEKFISERGEGIHHFCFEVSDIKKALIELKKKGIQLVHEIPQKGAEGSLVAFIHPKMLNGALIELKEQRRPKA